MSISHSTNSLLIKHRSRVFIKTVKMSTKTLLAVTLLALATFGNVNGIFWGDLRVTFSLIPGDPNAFQPLPKTVKEANENGWVIDIGTCSPTAGFNGFRYIFPQDDSVAVIFDINGIIAGVQAFFPHELMLTPDNDIRFDLVDMFQNETNKRGQNVFVLTAYFIPPTEICEQGRNEDSLITDGVGTGLYFQKGPNPSKFTQVPMKRAEAIEEGWMENGCIPAMGRHNFYKVEEWDSQMCREIQPTFALYSSGDELQGFGFIVGGTAESKRFEYPNEDAIRAVIGLGNTPPQCIINQNKLIGSTTFHLYLTAQPWTITCI